MRKVTNLELIQFCVICVLGIFLTLALTGCTKIPKPKLLLTDNPPGYECKVHGELPKAYKVGVKYYCVKCVDDNIGQVELYLPKGEKK